MSKKTTTLPIAPIAVLALCFSFAVRVSGAQEAKRPFTVADEIQLTLFGGSWTGLEEEVLFSPDGNYFAAETERGRLDLNRPEDSLRFYRSQDIKNFLTRSDGAQLPLPVWVVNRSTGTRGPIIRKWRWLRDSSGVAFLERTTGAGYRLVLADLRKKTIKPLTSATEVVLAFDVRDRRHYVYTSIDPADLEKLQAERQAPAIVATGRHLFELLFPDRSAGVSFLSHRYYLWAVVGGRRFQVKQDGEALVPDGYLNLALSPDGRSIVAALPVPEVSRSWETLYPPPFVSDPYRIRSSHTGSTPRYRASVHQWVRVLLQTGSVQSLTEAPISSDAGLWAWGGSSPSWSSDGQEILLPGTFLSTKDNAPSRPCVAVVNLGSNTRSCVEMLKGKTETGIEEGYHLIKDASFIGGDSNRIIVSFHRYENFASVGTTEYRRATDGTWQVVGQIKGVPEFGHDGLEINVKQGLNEPPLLVAANKQTSRVIWDPNPQLKDIDLGQATVYAWKDKEGHDWKGGLYKPSDHKAGRRYPLVIQTHGFYESEFIPSGTLPTAFAARALAAAGIVVLQVGEHCPSVTPGEGPCAVSGYESAANQLVSEGLVDPERIGIIGFSRTGFYVMEALTTGSLDIKAASITDSTLGDYLQYMTTVDYGENEIAHEYDSMIGAKPFGEGLQNWLKRSPGFNLDKITAPLLVVGEGPGSLLFMWGPYAGLRYLHKPVELVMLNDDEHVLTNPAVRMASQGGSVDWFRFWLKDEEDPEPAKAEQYARWRELRKLQTKIGRLRLPSAPG